MYPGAGQRRASQMNRLRAVAEIYTTGANIAFTRWRGKWKWFNNVLGADMPLPGGDAYVRSLSRL